MPPRSQAGYRLRSRTGYVTRIHAAFANALSNHGMSHSVAGGRADVLAPLALGAFVIARGADSPSAATSAAVVAPLNSWR